MFHKVKYAAPLKDFKLTVQFAAGVTKVYDFKRLFDMYPQFKMTQTEFEQVYVDVGGYGIIFTDELDLSSEELWENGKEIKTPFDGLIAMSDATQLWGLNESTLRKAIAYGKLVNGVDVCKYGKQWVISMKALEREYGKQKI